MNGQVNTAEAKDNTPALGRDAPLTVFAPASIGNVSVGFDALGLALAPLDGTLLGDTVRIFPGEVDDWQLELSGPYASELPNDPEANIVILCCRRYQSALADLGQQIKPLRIRLEKRLPIGSGLGSSATSVVAALEVLNRWHSYPLGSRELFRMMAEVEGGISGEVHLDNVAPCLYGGLRLCPPGAHAEYALPWPARWRMVVCWPGTELVTREARAVLPEQVTRQVAVSHGARFAQFVYALYTGNTGLAAASMEDSIAEPYRRRLLPGFDEARIELREAGALSVGISGSGPTIFALADDDNVARDIARWLGANYQKNERGFVHICRADLGGARSLTQ